MPGQARWRLIEGQVTGQPENASLTGDLRDTGYGYPALNAAADREAPGVLCAFEPTTMTRILAGLDVVEGIASRLFTRQLRNVNGTLAWVYLAGDCAGIGTPINAWR
ncbi:gamma-glutamylcyclotransferase [Actinoplanes sp. NPDC049802]|uniref:gamma-glutamylcyclotransferase n=1 Tax=Actinoplanes sp. NPDC049802 TaxID=3154742 RepID=UPI003408A93B